MASRCLVSHGSVAQGKDVVGRRPQWGGERRRRTRLSDIRAWSRSWACCACAVAAVIDGRGDAVADWAAGAKPRWSDLPHLAGIVGRAYGSPLGKMRLVGGVWCATAGTFWVLLLGATQVRGRVRATTHAVVIVDEPSPVTRSELGRLIAIFGAMVLAVVAFQATAMALLIALGAGSRWVRWGPQGLLLIMMVMLMVEVTPVCRRATKNWGRTARVGRELRAAGGSVVTAGTLAAWPRGRGHARELITILSREADRVGVDIVIGAVNAELAETYSRYGWRPRCVEDPLILVRIAGGLRSAEEPVPGTREP